MLNINILIANRARSLFVSNVRLRKLGIESVAVYTQADQDSLTCGSERMKPF